MRSAVIVIGSSYGDEGKGLAAAWAAEEMAKPCLNVLINGGAQRGHTVDLPDGRRHIFHHFGSGAVHGAVSCADEDFIVNPLLFGRELAELQTNLGLSPRLVISDRCRCSTPYDMMLGQILEENRGARRHGSCGCGIQETRLRYLNTGWALRWGELAALPEADFLAYCRRIVAEYIPARLKSLGMKASDEWQAVLNDERVAAAAWLDLRDMLAATEGYADWPALAAGYQSLVFEAGQGLALDAENKADFPYLTPSRTTSQAGARRIAALPGETRVRVLYVTRSYFTRHGAGPFPTECPKERINPRMTDRTNVPNPHQASLRYGLFDSRALLDRTMADLAATRGILPDAESALLVTHLNETGGELCGDTILAALAGHFDRTFVSDSPFARPKPFCPA